MHQQTNYQASLQPNRSMPISCQRPYQTTCLYGYIIPKTGTYQISCPNGYIFPTMGILSNNHPSNTYPWQEDQYGCWLVWSSLSYLSLIYVRSCYYATQGCPKVTRGVVMGMIFFFICYLQYEPMKFQDNFSSGCM